MAYHQNDFPQQNDWNQGWDGYDLSHIDDQQQSYADGGGGMAFDDQQFGSFDYSGQQTSSVPAYDYPTPFQPIDTAATAPAAAPVDLGNDYSSAFMAPPPMSQPYTGAIFQPQPHMQRQPSLGIDLKVRPSCNNCSQHTLVVITLDTKDRRFYRLI